MEPAAAAAALVADATSALRAVAEPDDAPAMQAYMKTSMPFLGVRRPARAIVLRTLVGDHPVADEATMQVTTAALWGLPHREEKYLAIDWARRWRQVATLDSMGLYERLVVEGAWWDLVDGVASYLVGDLLLAHRDALRPILEEWVDDQDLWRRRTAIICQLRHGEATDRDMLFGFCLRRAHDDEFFIRKAIGWSLRQYARVAPDAVRTFVLDHHTAWSGLTHREAMKHLPA